MATVTCNTDGCTREFPNEIALRMHRQRVHLKTGGWKPSGPTFKCDVCGQDVSEKNRGRHMRMVHNKYVNGPRVSKQEVKTKRQLKQREAPPVPDMALSKPKSRTLGELFERKKVGRPKGSLNDPARKHDQVACPVEGCGKLYFRGSLSTHLRNIHGIYRTPPRDPKNLSKVKQMVGRLELNVNRLPVGPGTALIATRHLEITRSNGGPDRTDAVPPVVESNQTQFMAIRIQALIQIAEMIVKL